MTKNKSQPTEGMHPTIPVTKPPPPKPSILKNPEGAYDPRIEGPIGDAYERYDSDPRVGGIDNFVAFADAIEPLMDSSVFDDDASDVEIVQSSSVTVYIGDETVNVHTTVVKWPTEGGRNVPSN